MIMKTIENVEEKRLIIARYFINQKNSNKVFGEQEIYYMWNNYFPSDFRLSQKQKFKLKFRKDSKNGYLVLPENKIPKDVLETYSNRWNKYYCWIVRYVTSHTLESCDTDIRDIRNKQYRQLIKLYKPLGYYVRNTTAKISDAKMAMFHISKNNVSRSEDFAGLMNYAKELKNK